MDQQKCKEVEENKVAFICSNNIEEYMIGASILSCTSRLKLCSFLLETKQGLTILALN